jgi:hypothetical protein
MYKGSAELPIRAFVDVIKRGLMGLLLPLLLPHKMGFHNIPA